MNNKNLFIKRYKNKDWKPFLGEDLPQNIVDILKTQDAFRSGHGNWLIGSVYYKGDTPETCTDIIVVMDDGSYYKCFAEYALWHTKVYTEEQRLKFPHLQEKSLCMQCCWSYKHLLKTMRNFIETGDTLFDPGYQT